MRLRISVAILAVTLLAAVACTGDGSPSSPASPRLVLSNAMVSVAGQSVNGQTMQVGHGAGASTRFEAQLHDGTMPALHHYVDVEYTRPGGMMHQQHGQFRLWDDGTHGDPIAGDGIYCLEDWEGTYGCHGATAPAGEYRFEFSGMDDQGHRSNTVSVTVNLVR